MYPATCAALFCALATLFHLATVAIAALRCRHRSGQPRGLTGQPAVSLLRPVCGLDAYPRETLESSFRLDYPDYEILFCAARDNDLAVPLVAALIAANRQVPARLLIGDDAGSVNPKLNNLNKGWIAARHDWIVVADSNVVLPSDCLQRLQARWRRNTGAVCSMPIASRPQNFPAELECAFLNTLQARVQYAAEALGRGFAQGKTMMFRRDLIDATGGWRMLAAETAEDAAMTKLVRAAGLCVHLVDVPFEQPLGRRGWREVWARQLRWARLRRLSFVWLFVPEAIVGSFFPALALALAAPSFGIDPVGAVIVLLAVWFGAELALARCAGWRLSLLLLPALLLRDLLLPALWVGAWLGDGFVWRGTAMTAARAPRRAGRCRRWFRHPVGDRAGQGT
jgi:ceramide glucosyltransferase